MNGVGITSFARQVSRGRARVDVQFAFVSRNFGDGQTDRRCRHVGNHVDFFCVVPLTRNVGANIRLVLVIRANNFNFQGAF